MKVEGYLFGFGTITYVILGSIYWVLSREPVGTTALALTGGMAFLIAFYLLFTGRQVDPRPEDALEADVVDYAGEYGFFSPTSWWPLPVGFFAALTGTGLLLNGHDLQNLIFEGSSQVEVNDFKLLKKI